MKIPLMLLIASVSLVVSNNVSAEPVQFKKERMLFIGQQKDALEDYIKEKGVPDGFMAYTSIQKIDGLDIPMDYGGGVQHAGYFTKKYPKAALQMGLYMRDALEDVLAGNLDGNIKLLGQWIKKTRRPVLLRIGYEFDLPDNRYNAQNYVKVFRYIVDHLREQKVDNASFVWHSAIRVEEKTDYMKWYPGDDYVDWFGISYFNTNQTRNAEDFLKLAQAHGKPFMIAEAAPAGLYTMRGRLDWFNRFSHFITTHPVPVVSYINCNWDWYPMFKEMHWGDSRILADPQMKDRWNQFIKELNSKQ